MSRTTHLRNHALDIVSKLAGCGKYMAAAVRGAPQHQTGAIYLLCKLRTLQQGEQKHVSHMMCAAVSAVAATHAILILNDISDAA